jgi:23S rRNA (guanosine2251-2'-O)-methyltransferase
VVEVEGGTLTALAGFDGHQGIAAVVAPRTWATLDDILARAIERKEPPFILALDSLEDPQNVGTLLRTAEAAGVHGVIFPTHRQAPLTPAAVKASAGAVEHLLLAPVDDLAAALADLHIRGVRIVGAEADAPLTARQSDLRGPLAIVVGSEGQGLGPAVRRRADQLMRIPMHGQIESLNAAVAGSVLLFEAVAQRDPEGRGETPRTPGSQRALPEPPRSAAGASAPVPASKPPTGERTDAAPDGAVAEEVPVELRPRRTRARRAPATVDEPVTTGEPEATAEPVTTAEPAATAEPAPGPAISGDDLLPGGSAEARGEDVPLPAPKKRASRAKTAADDEPAAASKPRKRASKETPEAAASEPPASAKPARRRTPRA